MSQGSSGFDDFLRADVEKYRGIYMPVKAGLLRRALIRKAAVGRLHPNPDDEFCSPEIGPNEEIVTRYGQRIAQLQGHPVIQAFGEPITVEKIRPDGYLILNGHHRWAAAVKWKLKKVPIEIVDLTQESDLRDMFRKVKHDRRISLDLDEVVFGREDREDMLERPLPFPLNRIYRQRLRLGIPALFRFFRNKGYDVWVYSAHYYSMDYIRNLFRHYSVRVTGIVTGTERKGPKTVRVREELKQQFESLYVITLHADRNTLVWVDNAAKAFHEYPLSDGPRWAAEIMDIIRGMSEHEKKTAHG